MKSDFYNYYDAVLTPQNPTTGLHPRPPRGAGQGKTPFAPPDKRNPDSEDKIEKRTYVVSAAEDMLTDAEDME
jgi:hypothetical protein